MILKQLNTHLYDSMVVKSNKYEQESGNHWSFINSLSDYLLSINSNARHCVKCWWV